jgi:hypothetical protein
VTRFSGFSGFEPQVGEIRALRTFRVGPAGVLYPLFDTRPWVDGANEARCRITDEPEHAVPEPDCTCGFYAYADQRAAGEYPFARYVLAVVACWGRVVAGTKGIRAQYGRIEALWFSPVVPAALVQAATERYPSVAVYSDAATMLREHPLTHLDVYEPEQLTPPWRRRIGQLAALAAVVAGVLPTSFFGEVPDGWFVWGALLAALLGGVVLGRARLKDPSVQRRRLICLALALWMIAPLTAPLGLLLFRLPLAQLALITVVHRLALRRVARTFPAPIA